jgi:hypothetical protein
MKEVLLTAILAFMAIYTSGCATLLGGIIGHQSGEWAAGAAIGAGFDFGGGIVDGIGWMLTDEETRFEQKVSLDSEQGKICLAKSDFSLDRVEKLMRRLEKKFKENGWSYSLVEKKMRVGRTLLSEKWQCANADGEFELNVLQEKCKAAQITIEPAGDGTLNKSAVTVEIYTWLKEAALGAG